MFMNATADRIILDNLVLSPGQAVRIEAHNDYTTIRSNGDTAILSSADLEQLFNIELVILQAVPKEAWFVGSQYSSTTIDAGVLIEALAKHEKGQREKEQDERWQDEMETIADLREGLR